MWKYSKYYDTVVNWGLRAKRLSGIAFDIIKELYNELDDAKPTTKSITLYRGIHNGKNFKVDKLKPGDILYEPGFSSKTIDLPTAMSFTQQGCCLLEITYPPGSKFIQLEEYSQFPDEREYLSYPGETFEIKRTSSFGNFTIYEAFPLPNSPPTLDKIEQMVDHNIDEMYPDFRECIGEPKDVPIYFQDVNLIMCSFIPTGAHSVRYYNTAEHHEEDVEDKIYTLYASGAAKNVFVLPRLEKWGDNLTKIKIEC